jgi:hypothetical protein
MGSSQSFYVIYLQDCTKSLIPIEWMSLARLKEYILENFGYDSEFLEIQESSEHTMKVSTDTSFKALIPKYKLVESNRHVYYIIVNLPINFEL